jgi:hypothetical protein
MFGRRRTMDPDEARISRGMLYLPGQRPLAVSRLGQGMFTQAWKGADGKVYLDVDDAAYEKEILAEISRETRNKHLPRVESLAFTPRGRLYRMPLYASPLRAYVDTPKGESTTAWRQYRVIKDCWDSAYAAHWRSVYDGYAVKAAVVECARESKLPGALVRALELLAENSDNYGSSYTFEVSPRNLATDRNGNLILLDVLFDAELVQRRRGRRGLRERMPR